MTFQARWHEIESLFNTVVGMTGGERAAFIRDFCGDDYALRDEVASLLTELEENSGFLEDSVLKTGLRVMNENENLVSPEKSRMRESRSNA